MIVKTHCETDGSFYSTKICNCHHQAPLPRRCSPPELRMWVPALVLPLLAVAKVAAKQCRASSDCPPQSPHCSDWGWCQVSRHQIQIILLPPNLQHLVGCLIKGACIIEVTFMILICIFTKHIYLPFLSFTFNIKISSIANQ